MMEDFAKLIPALALMSFGAILFLAGAGLDLTGIGLPVGIGVDAIGVLMIIAGAGMLGFGKKDTE